MGLDAAQDVEVLAGDLGHRGARHPELIGPLLICLGCRELKTTGDSRTKGFEVRAW